MIFGDSEIFAIEAILDEYVDGFILGHFVFWINGSLVGNIADTVALQACANYLKESLSSYDARELPEGFCNYESLFRKVMNVLYLGDEYNHAQTLQYEKYLLNNVGMSSFDDIYIIVVNGRDNCEHMLWMNKSGEEIYEAILPCCEYERIGNEFLQWITLTDEWRQYKLWLDNFIQRKKR